MKLGLLYSRIRKDEKLLLGELRERGHEVEKLDVRDLRFGLSAETGTAAAAAADCDLVLDRCLATSRSLYAGKFFAHYGVPVINAPETAEVCANKVKNSLALDAAGVPTPATEVAFTTDAALEAVESFGYPCVIKPVVGSWGRLMAKIDSRTAAEAILEHKETLGHYEHKVFYVQEFVDKPGRDIRVVACDGEPVAAMTRSSEHWLTNAATGGQPTAFELDDEAERLVRDASAAVGGGLLGVDLMEMGSEARSASDSRVTRDSESPANHASGQEAREQTAEPRDEDGGYTVHEVNHTVEFKALDSAVDIDVPAAVVDWLELKAEAAGGDEVTAPA